MAKNLTPSTRGETEIIDVMKHYLAKGCLGVEPITRGVAWLDTGTPKSLLEASSYISAIEERQGLKVACLEEIALRMGFLNKNQYLELLQKLPAGTYRNYLELILQDF